MPADDLGSVAPVERRVVAPGELVAVRRHQALEGVPHEDKLEVAAEASVDLGDGELGERAEVPRHMGLVGRDGEGVRVAAVTGEDHQDSLPIGAGYLGGDNKRGRLSFKPKYTFILIIKCSYYLAISINVFIILSSHLQL